MGCDIHLKITNYKDEEFDDVLLRGVDLDPSFQELTDVILNLPSEKRKNILTYLLNARKFTYHDLLAQEVPKLNEKGEELPVSHLRYYTSNITVNDIYETFPDLKEKYGDIEFDVTDNYTLILTKSLDINGLQYFGRIVEPNGHEAFVIHDRFGAEHFLSYIRARKIIEHQTDKYKEIIKPYTLELTNLAKHYKKSIESMLIDYLNNVSKYKDYVEDEKYVIPRRILNKVLCEILGKYDIYEGKSDLQLALENFKSKKDDKWSYTLAGENLYKVLKSFSDDIPTKEEFLALDKDAMTALLRKAFAQDAYLYKYVVLKIDTKAKKEKAKDKEKPDVTKIKQDEIRDAYKAIKTTFLELGIKLGSLEKAIKEYPTIREELKARLAKDGRTDIEIVEDGKKVIVTCKTNSTPTNTPNSITVYLKSPYGQSVLDIYGIGFDSKYLHTLVTSEEDPDIVDGKFHGVYVYKYKSSDGRTIHYAPSRDIFSPASSLNHYNTLDLVKRKIMIMNGTEKISERPYHKFHSATEDPRNLFLKGTNFKLKEILTVLDIVVPNYSIDNLPTELRDVIFGTVPLLHELIGVTPKLLEIISLIETPQEANAFIYLLFLRLYSDSFDDLAKFSPKTLELYRPKNDERSIEELLEDSITRHQIWAGWLANLHSNREAQINKGLTFEQKIRGNIDIIKLIVDIIKNANYKSYMVVGKDGLSYTFDLLLEENNNFLPSGKFEDDSRADKPLISQVENAVKYFNDTYGTNILTMTASELDEFVKTENEKIKVENEEIAKKNEKLAEKDLTPLKKYFEINLSKVRGFVYNGNIYINSSNCDLSDVYHEMAHIFFGVLKATNQDAYQGLMDTYIQNTGFLYHFNTIKRLYGSLAYLDLLEETVVDMIASTLNLQKCLVRQIDNPDITNLLLSILGRYPEILKGSAESGLEFTEYFKILIAQNTSLIVRNMKISQLLKSRIADGTIKEKCS